MDPLQGIAASGQVGPARARPAPTHSTGFNVSAGATAAMPAAVTEISLSGLLALQEAGGDAAQDREARRHGYDLLAELGALQRDLLAGHPDDVQLQRLGRLADTVPAAADPQLRDIVAAIALRAKIEFVRYTNGSR